MGAVSIVKINALVVPDELRAELEKRFSSRAGLVETADGFERFELLRPVEGTDRYLVYTRWRSEEDFQNWMTGSMSARAHGGGGRPAATDSSAWSFEVIEQTGPKTRED